MSVDQLRILELAREAYEAVTSLYEKLLVKFFESDSRGETARLLIDTEKARLRFFRNQLRNALTKLHAFVPEMPLLSRLYLWKFLGVPVTIDESLEMMIDNLLRPLLLEKNPAETNGIKTELIDEFNSVAGEMRRCFRDLHLRFVPILNELETLIVEALGADLLKGEAIANLLEAKHYSYNSHFKETLSSLVKRGILAKKSGYFNPGKYQPEKSGQSPD